jgi:hypothetical protein
MEYKNELYELIISLTKSEKRYFKVFSSLHGGQKNYLKFFDAIEKQKYPDEKRLKKILIDERITRNIYVAKRYLSDILLKSMRSYRVGKLSSSVVRALLADMEFLYGKGLNKACAKHLKKALELTQTNDDFNTMLELMKWEKRLLMEDAGDLKRKEKKINELLKKEKHVLRQIENAGMYSALVTELILLFQKEGMARTKATSNHVDKIIQHPLLRNVNKALSLTARTVFYNAHFLAAYIEHDFNKALKNKIKMMALVEFNEQAIMGFPLYYIANLNHLLILYHRMNRYDNHFYATLNKLKSFPTSKFVDRSNVQQMLFQVFIHAVPLELSVHRLRGTFMEAVKTMPEIEKQLEIYKVKMIQEALWAFYSCIFNIYFGANDFRTAQKWINKLLNELNEAPRRDLQAVIRVLN